MKYLPFSLLFLSCLVSMPALGVAQMRGYEYTNLAFRFAVHEDTTVVVEELQTYAFRGTYHQGWRSIPLKGIGSITDIEVVDVSTGVRLVHSSIRLDKTVPSSWGKYTSFVQDGEQVIEWYYDATDTNHTWLLRYTLHGVIAFYTDHDELYWNLFTKYEVPVNAVSIDLILPRKVPSSGLTFSVYTDSPGNRLEQGGFSDDQHFTYTAGNFPPRGIFTFAVGWPKGVVSQQAYWFDFVHTYSDILLTLLVVFATIAAVVLRWYGTERYNTGRGVIIPEYEPPEHLPPLMAEIIATERLTSKAWAATIVDLAVRGYLTITEEADSVVWKVVKILSRVLQLMLVIFFLSIILIEVVGKGDYFILIAAFFLATLMYRRGMLKLKAADYFIMRRRADDGDLREYEKELLLYLGLSIPEGRFSTKDIRTNPGKARELSLAMKKLTQNTLRSIERETPYYEIGFRLWDKFKFFPLFGLAAVYIGLYLNMERTFFEIITVSSAVLWAIVFFRFNPRLNRQGQIVREEWLGFKMYLETAEKNRLQNLTPDRFEKFLPYAIIFHVEKEWGRAFQSIHLSPPSWYGARSYGATSIPTSGFSPAAFSTSFSSSFATAFASAGGGGSGGASGGGGAGGGGGGGGGGAS